MAAEEVPGGVLAGISTELVRLHHRIYGRGPSQAKSFLADDALVCILREGLTTVEKTLVDEGKVDVVHLLRRGARGSVEGPARAIVEQALGRKVIAYMSEIQPETDLTVEVFVLEPLAS